MPRNLPQKSNDFLSGVLPAVPLRRFMMSLMPKATWMPLAGYASAAALVGSTLVVVVGLDSKTTDLKGHPLNSGLDRASKASVVSSQTESAVNFLAAVCAALRSLKSKGTSPSMYCSGAWDTSTHWNFCA